MRIAIFLVAILLTASLIEELSAQCGQPDEALSSTFKQAEAKGLSQLKSDEEAKLFFQDRLRQTLGFTDGMAARSAKGKSAQPPVFPPEWVEIGIKLTSELATRQFADRLKKAVDSGEPAVVRTFLDQTRPQEQWLSTDSSRSELNRAISLATVVSDFLPPAPEIITSGEIVDRYTQHLDRTFPHLIESSESWVHLAEHDGAAGIRRRLMAFWENASTAHVNLSDSEKQALASQYFFTRLKPVLTAQAVASATRADTAAEQRIQSHWKVLRTASDTSREVNGQARLCGTWQWTIHNHQRHLDQKVAMVFAHPDNKSFAGPRPAKAVVLGDVVYLRWEFPGVVQEDSLLFTGEGQRLEGSFVNSSGAWGSITGKRTAPCTP
jgi:hypothetical protein